MPNASPVAHAASWLRVRYVGQLTTAVAMGDALIERLNLAGIRFSVLSG